MNSRTAIGFVAALLTTCSLTAQSAQTQAGAAYWQTQPKTAESNTAAKSGATTAKKSPVLARNTTRLAANTESAAKPAATVATTDKVQGKTVISRCWQRLMKNVREIRQAHRKK